jgi:hypothetical protein
MVVHTKSLFYKLSDLLDDNTRMLWFLFYVFISIDYKVETGEQE